MATSGRGLRRRTRRHPQPVPLLLADVARGSVQDLSPRGDPGRREYLVEKGRGRFIRGRFLRSKGIEVLLGTEVVKIEEGVGHARDGRRLGFDLTVLAVGITPLEIFRESGL